MTTKTKKVKKYNTQKNNKKTLNLINKNSYNLFKNDIYNISKCFHNLYENIKIKIEHFDESLKERLPSYYKCFLICIKNNMDTDNKILLNEIRYIIDFLKNYTTYSINDNINNINLTQKQLTRLNNIVEDFCPNLER